jgi:hypothetical protein
LLLIATYFGLALAAVVAGYRSLHDSSARRRIETVSVAFILAAFLTVTLGWLPMWMTGRPWLGWNTLPLLALPVVIGLGIAIAFYRLFDIKIVISGP